jgi:uncharacterized membrane protein
MTSFLTDEEEATLVAEIRQQEQRTSAEIRVCICEKLIFFPERYAWRMFEKIGMRQTRQRNGALIVIIPSRKKIVILGDTGFDAVVPPGFWEESVNAMVKQMHQLGPLEALLEGLRRLGDTLAIHWPAEPGDRNELPDEILR